MPYFFTCSKQPKTHAASHYDTSINGHRCMISACGGKYEVIRYANGTPHEYAKSAKACSVKFPDGSRALVSPRPYTSRVTRGAEQRRDMINARRPGFRQATPPPTAQDRTLSDSDSDSGSSSDSGSESDADSISEAEDITDPDFLGEAVVFKGVNTRLSARGTYASRPNLDALANATAMTSIMVKRADIGAAMPRGSGQANAMGNRTAEQASGRNLPRTSIFGRGGATVSVASEEWCHLIAAVLGGGTDVSNLVAASYACNTYMMTIETFCKFRSDLIVQVFAYCVAGKPNVAEAIRYKVIKKMKTKEKEVFNQIIDATSTHFAKSDLSDLRRKLKSQIGKAENGVKEIRRL